MRGDVQRTWTVASGDGAMAVETKVVCKFDGMTGRMYWSDGWEHVDELAGRGLLVKVHYGAWAYGHTDLYLAEMGGAMGGAMGSAKGGV